MMSTIKHILYWFCLILPVALFAAPVPAPPQIAASGHMLIDFDSGEVLSAVSEDRRLDPASLTKIMTAYTVFHELKTGGLTLDDKVLISKKAWQTPGSRMFIEVGKQVTVNELIHGMIIQSGNDACVALAEHIAGSEAVFAGMMNEHAVRLGMDQTNFMNATGLPHKDHYTTPQDILKITQATIREFPDFYRLYSIKEYTFNNIKQHNRNKLLWADNTVDGVKTGHTDAAGYCLVASAKRENMRLLSVVMGTESEIARAVETQSLLNFGFRFYKTHRLYDAGATLKNVRVWKGSQESLKLGVAETLHITVPRGQYQHLEARTRVNKPVEAPIKKGQRLGRVIIELEGEIITEVPLIALQDVAEGGFFHNITDSVLMMLE